MSGDGADARAERPGLEPGARWAARRAAGVAGSAADRSDHDARRDRPARARAAARACAAEWTCAGLGGPMTRLTVAAAALTAVAVAACVPSPATVRAPIDRLLHDRLAVDPVASAEVDALLAAPLTRASITRIVVARHPRVVAALAQLGVAAGELGTARGLGHTELELSAKVVGSDPSIELAVVHDVLDLLLVGPRRAAGEAGLAAAQARAGAAILDVTTRAELAFLDVAAATEQLVQARTAFDAVAASTELTTRIAAAGGTTELALARAQAARERARVEVAHAEVALELARTQLDGAAGLSGDATRWRLGEALPGLPDEAPALDTLEAEAVAASLELLALARDADAHGNGARAAAIAGWLPGLGVGVAVEHSEHGTAFGPALRVGLPFFSGTRGVVASERARTRVDASLRTAWAIETRAAARAARVQALGAYAEARQLRDVLVPLQRRVLGETLLQYNAMNASPFELLLARHELAEAEHALVEARHQLARALVTVQALRRGATIGESHASP